MQLGNDVVIAVVSALGGGGLWQFLSSRLTLGTRREDRIMDKITQERDRVDQKLTEQSQVLAKTNAILFLLVAEIQRLDPNNIVVKYALDAMQDIADRDADAARRQMEQIRASTASVIRRMAGETEQDNGD